MGPALQLMRWFGLAPIAFVDPGGAGQVQFRMRRPIVFRSPPLLPFSSSNPHRPVRAVLYAMGLGYVLISGGLFGFNMFVVYMNRQFYGTLHPDTMTSILTGFPLSSSLLSGWRRLAPGLKPGQTTINLILFLVCASKHRRLLQRLESLNRVPPAALVAGQGGGGEGAALHRPLPSAPALAADDALPRLRLLRHLRGLPHRAHRPVHPIRYPLLFPS